SCGHDRPRGRPHVMPAPRRLHVTHTPLVRTPKSGTSWAEPATRSRGVARAFMKRDADEIDTDPSSPQSRRAATEPGLGAPRSHAPAPAPAPAPPVPMQAPAPPPRPIQPADSIDEILEGITSRPRDTAPVTPRVTAESSGDVAASYQSRARTPNP